MAFGRGRGARGLGVQLLGMDVLQTCLASLDANCLLACKLVAQAWLRFFFRMAQAWLYNVTFVWRISYGWGSMRRSQGSVPVTQDAWALSWDFKSMDQA